MTKLLGKANTVPNKSRIQFVRPFPCKRSLGGGAMWRLRPRCESIDMTLYIVRYEAMGRAYTMTFSKDCATKSYWTVYASHFSLPNPVRGCTEQKLEVSLRNGEEWRLFSLLSSNFCFILDQKIIPAFCHGAKKHHRFVRFNVSYDDAVSGRRSSSRGMVATATTRRRVEELRRKAGKLIENQREGHRNLYKKMDRLRSQQSLAVCSSFLVELWGDDRVVGDDFYSTFIFEHLQKYSCGVVEILQHWPLLVLVKWWDSLPPIWSEMEVKKFGLAANGTTKSM